MEIYVVFSKTGTWLSRALTYFVKTKYIHTSISFEKDLSLMYSFGRVNPEDPFRGGFTEENIQKGVYQFSPLNEIIVYKMEITEQQMEQLRSEIERFKMEQTKYHYNFLGLFGAYLKVPYIRENYYFCSQFVSELMIKINVLDHSIRPEFVSPPELIHLMNLECIYEGYILQYPYLQEDDSLVEMEIEY